MKRLPVSLHSSSVSEKLVWLHIHSNPGEHSARSLAADLGGSSRTWSNALSGLIDAGFVVVEKAPAGVHGGQYRVAPKL
ncbi:hypothetical protein [Deinococcus humi]|uniref:Putative transcriptional regulator n=1 Tax=Deinococcus humi TaxID=662880 RepID=A0A7W8JYW2_9DEIO|nr:hypothetical protein [Deinococcus humi]MBB5365704.1 putative transcriptional regulator [Deinococcus humi]GGO37189.1 hypothetical protein GCM10008949_42110 [Deinococcus humi]